MQHDNARKRKSRKSRSQSFAAVKNQTVTYFHARYCPLHLASFPVPRAPKKLCNYKMTTYIIFA